MLWDPIPQTSFWFWLSLTTRDPVTGEKSINQEPLKTLAKIHRGEDGAINFGQNVAVLEPGIISVGDTVELID